MRDLFGSTSFIKFEVLETILSSSDELESLLTKKEDSSFLDLISNLDSYLYGLIMLKKENDEIKKWLNNYIFILYMNLIKRNSLYIVKSYLLKEIMNVDNDSSRIDITIKDYIKEIKEKIKETIQNSKTNLEKELEKIYDIGFLKNYYEIYKDKSFITKISKDKNKKEELKKEFDFLK